MASGKIAAEEEDNLRIGLLDRYGEARKGKRPEMICSADQRMRRWREHWHAPTCSQSYARSASISSYARSEEGNAPTSVNLTTPQPTIARGAEEPGEYLLHDIGDASTCDDTRVGGCVP